MKERIKKYMDHKGLSAAELADIIGVQRSNLSHILTGRNNPGSSFIEKLLQTYPELDARWLITGEGDMILTPKAEKQERPAADLFSSASLKESPASLQKNTPEVIKEGNIDRIIVLYKDKTFVDYRPGQ
jgi:transcriptional regulator with XRE-family HTH domain